MFGARNGCDLLVPTINTIHSDARRGQRKKKRKVRKKWLIITKCLDTTFANIKLSTKI